MNMNNKLIILLITLFFLSNCQGVMMSRWFDSGLGDEIIDVDDDTDADFDEGSTIGTSSTIGNPSLQKNMLAFKSDSGDNVPVVGLENAIADFADGDQVIISDVELEAEVACLEKGSTDRWFEGSMVKKISNLVISEAHAEETAASICDDEDKTCCPIQDDGSFECFYPLVDQSVASVFISVVDSDGNYVTDEVTEETIQPNLMYLRNSPDDVAKLDDTLYALGDTKGVSFVTDTESELRVDDYEKFEAAQNASKMDYSSEDGLVGVLTESGGIQLFEKDGDDITYLGDDETDTDENAISYTFIRPINGFLYFGFEQDVSSEAYIMYSTTDELYDTESHRKIFIMEDEDSLTHTKTLAYDEIDIGWSGEFTIAAYVDNLSQIRLRLIKTLGENAADRLDGSVWKTTTDASIKDLQIYYDDNSEIVNFAILDDMNNKIRIGSYDDVTDAGITYNIDDEKAVDVGSSPESMHYSATSGKLYVLSQGAKNVAVIPLMSDTETIVATPAISTTIDLTGLITDYAEKGITLSPNSMTFLDASDKIIVGDATTKAAIEVDVSAYEEELPTP
ncbi:MAG: hypothetical protein ABII18_01995 [bacterium]